MFDWQQFLAAQGVPFVTRGPNTGRDQVSIRCPWCGEADRSQHLAISLSGAGWRCLRNPTAHKGKSRAFLIGALLGVGPGEARRLAGYTDRSPTPTDEDFGLSLGKLLGTEAALPEPRKPIKPLSDFKPLAGATGSLAEPFWDYLADRGYGPVASEWAAKAYGLWFAVRGPYRYRIVIPIYTASAELSSWTARSIVDDEPVRYRTLPTNPREGYTGPLSFISPTKLLLGLPLLNRVSSARVLVLCEGPFDAIRISTLGHRQGIYGTCLFGLNVSEDQVQLLDQLSGRFRKLVLLLDPDASLIRLRLLDRLAGLKIRCDELPTGVEDPGALTASTARALFESWL